jgi:hypothetical protein
MYKVGKEQGGQWCGSEGSSYRGQVRGRREGKCQARAGGGYLCVFTKLDCVKVFVLG